MNIGDFAFSFLVTNEDYIVRDHRVHQVRAVPGVTFVDTIYRYLQMKGFQLDQVELRNFIFIEPVVTTEQFDRKVRVTLTRFNEYWKISARSQKVKHDVVLSPEWSEHLQGEVHLTNEALGGVPLDIERLKREAKQMQETEHSYATLRHVAIDHYEFMKLLGNVYVGDGYVLGEVHLGDLAKAYLDYFYLHPAHLDGATSLPGIFARQKMDIDMSRISAVIPIFIGSFRTNGPFSDKQYVYVEEKKMVTPGSKDVFYADIEFYRANGSKLAAYQKFGYKRVRAQESITNLEKIMVEPKATLPPAVASTPVVAESHADLRTAIEQDLQEMIGAMLADQGQEIGREDDFYDLGLDSRNLMQLVQDLETKIGEKLYPTLLFEHMNIASLAEYFVEEYAAVYPVAVRPVVNAPQQTAMPQKRTVVSESAADEGQVREALKLAIEKDLQTMIGTMLPDLEQEIGQEDDFYDLGLDSRNLMQLVQDLETKLGEKLYPTLLFEHMNISSLAEYFVDEYANVYPVQFEVQSQQMALSFAQMAPGAETVAEPNEECVILSEEALKQAIAQDLQILIANMLEQEIEQVGLNDDFYELGLDSRNLMSIVQELEQKLGEKLYPTLLFEHMNILSLTDYLAEEYGTMYPVQARERVLTTKPQESQEPSQEPIEALYYRPVWEKRDFAGQGDTKLTGCILIFDETPELYEALQKRVGQTGAKVLLIKPGSAFKTAGEGMFEVKMSSTSSYVELFDHLQAQGVEFDKIIHSGSRGTALPVAEQVDEFLQQGPNALFHIGKALFNRKLKQKVQLFYVYRSQAGGQPLDAATVGFARSLGLEHTKLLVKTIEVKSGTKEQWPAGLSNMLVQEFQTDGVDENSICYVDEQRYVKCLRSIPADEMTNSKQVSVRENRTYLITGGLGGIGLHFARDLAKAKTNLVLIGRSEIKEEQKALLQELESNGTRTLYVRGDIGNRADLERIVAEAKETFGAIHGVIHSAGVIRDAVLARKDIDEFRAVLTPKVDGTLLLDELLRDEALDFFVMFSSSSAATGNVGQTDYAFANSFLDHMAQYRQRLVEEGQRSGKTLAINWPLWQDGGMHVDEQTANMMKEATGMYPLPTEHGIQAFYEGIRLPYSNLLLIEGETKKIQATLANSLTTNSDAVDVLEEMQDESAVDDGIEILGVSASVPTKSFMNQWTKKKNMEKSTIGRTNIKKDKLFSALQEGGHMFHLLTKLDQDRQLEVIISGSGTPVLMINGFGFTATSLIYQFTEMTANHQVINIHHPSIGLSNGNQELSLSALASTYVEVLKKLKITRPVHVIAASWGGMIAQMIAKEYPEMVASLTLACTFVNLDFFESGLKLNDKLKEEFSHLGYEEHYELVEKSIYKNYRGTIGYFKHFAKSAEMRYTTEEILTEITVPTLVVSGTSDMVVPPSQSKLVYEKVANSQFFEIPEAGHVPHITHHEMFNKRVCEFMEEHEAKRK